MNEQEERELATARFLGFPVVSPTAPAELTPGARTWDEFLERYLGLGGDAEGARRLWEALNAGGHAWAFSSTAAIEMLVNGNPDAPRPEAPTYEARNGRKKITYQRAPEQRPIAGRNQPCPCGSGKKAKRCCRSD